MQFIGPAIGLLCVLAYRYVGATCHCMVIIHTALLDPALDIQGTDCSLLAEINLRYQMLWATTFIQHLSC